MSKSSLSSCSNSLKSGSVSSDDEYLNVVAETPQKGDTTIYEGVVYYICFNNNATIGTHIVALDERLKRERNKELVIRSSYVAFMDELVMAGIKGFLTHTEIQFRVLFKIQFKYKEREQMEKLLICQQEFFMEQMNHKKNMIINHRKIVLSDAKKQQSKMKELMRYRTDEEYRIRKQTHARRAYHLKKQKEQEEKKKREEEQLKQNIPQRGGGYGGIPPKDDELLNTIQMNVKNVNMYLPVRRRGRPTKQEQEQIDREKAIKQGNPFSGLAGINSIV
jgi:hypothetical protein